MQVNKCVQECVCTIKGVSMKRKRKEKKREDEWEIRGFI